MNNFTLIEYSLYYAISAHTGQFRKDGITPYIVHPIEVMRLLQGCGVKDEKMLAVALLHDVLEDTRVTYEQLSSNPRFSGYVADRVQWLTIPPGITKEQYIESFGAKPMDLVQIKAADRLCNVKDFMLSHNPNDNKYAVIYLEKGEPIFRQIKKEYNSGSTDITLCNLYGKYIELCNILRAIS